MGRHDHIRAVFDRGLEGDQLGLPEFLIGLVHGGGPDMAVDTGVAVAGEVLVGRDDMVLRQAPGKGLAQLRHQLRVIREGPGPDHGVGGVVVHVDVRRKVHVEAQGRQFLAQNDPRGQRIVLGPVPGRADGHIAGHAGTGAQTDDDAALLIHRHKIGNAGRDAFDLRVVGLQVGDQLRRLSVADDIAAEQDDAAVLVPAQGLCQSGDLAQVRHVLLIPGPDRGNDHLGDLFVHGHPAEDAVRLSCQGRLIDSSLSILRAGHRRNSRTRSRGSIACAGRRIGIADRIGCISGPGIRSLRRDCRVRTCSIIRGAGRRRSLSHSLGRRHRAALRVLTVPAVSPAAAAGRQQDQSRSTQAHNPHKSFFSSLFHHEDYPLP